MRLSGILTIRSEVVIPGRTTPTKESSSSVRNSRVLIGVTSLAVAATTVLAGPSVSAEPGEAPATQQATAEPPSPTSGGRGAGTATAVEPLSTAQLIRRAAETAVSGDPIVMPQSYPYQPDLRIYRDNDDDAAHTAELLGHPDLAPRLLDLMSRSDRISTQVVGQSSEGRDLYLVTLTAPETAEETAEQAAWKNLMKDDPDAAAASTELLNNYKTPIWISNNIHGNEWEGTDAAMQYVEYLATAPLVEVGSILANNRVYFSLSLNPDGRTNATRATAIGLDPNRDMITNATPETKSFIRTAQAVQPIYAADFHGYTSVLQMEPCGPPHGSNYEYDLYMPHNYALALKVEKDVVDAEIPGNTYFNVDTRRVVSENTGPETAHIKIPYRDTPDGWDDFPPIFTAQYAAFYGAASATVELPLSRGAGGGRQSPERAVVNTAVAVRTMKSIVGYMNVAGHAKDMIKGQIEVFRRGSAGEPKQALTLDDVDGVPGPTEWKPLWDVADDQEPVTLPRAYVIPTGEGQRSSSDASSLVEQLLTHDVEVSTLDADATVDGTTYPAGSYVVDMHQPLRGLANVLLDLGEDISAKVPSMYDISAWSYSYTWGATVDKVGLTEDGPIGATTPIVEVPVDASVPTTPGYLTFDVAGVSDYEALNAILEEGAPVSMLADGSAVVGPESYDVAAAAAAEFDIAMEPATQADLAALGSEDTKALTDLTIAYSGNQDDYLSLTQLGFDDLVPVSPSSLNSSPEVLDDVDVVWVGGTFNPGVGSVGESALSDFLDDGGALVGKEGGNGNTGLFGFASRVGLMSGTRIDGNRSGNGIVAVDTPAGSVLSPYAQDYAFIYPAYSYADLGEGTVVEQTYDAETPYLAGHWRATNDTNGPESAAGNAAAVSATDEETGAKAFVFGTSPFFRTHPKGGLSSAARALFWAAPEGDPVLAPTDTGVTVAPVEPVTYPGAATVEVTVAAGDGTTPGTVELVADDDVIGTAEVADGTASIPVTGLTPGTTEFVAEFTPSSATFTPSASDVASIEVAKASSTLKLKAKKVAKKGRKVRVTLSLTVPDVSTRGKVTLIDNGTKRRVVTVESGAVKVVTLKLGKGKHKLRGVLAATGLVKRSTDRTRITIR